jgi:hypothetical protein
MYRYIDRYIERYRYRLNSITILARIILPYAHICICKISIQRERERKRDVFPPRASYHRYKFHVPPPETEASSVEEEGGKNKREGGEINERARTTTFCEHFAVFISAMTRKKYPPLKQFSHAVLHTFVAMWGKLLHVRIPVPPSSSSSSLPPSLPLSE